jgi:hypothetical protein
MVTIVHQKYVIDKKNYLPLLSNGTTSLALRISTNKQSLLKYILAVRIP